MKMINSNKELAVVVLFWNDYDKTIKCLDSLYKQKKIKFNLILVDNNSDVVRGCELIHKANPTKGCYNIQLILTSDGTVMPFEINPRISTTYCLTVASGIDPIDIFLQNDNLNGLMKIKKQLML